MAKPKQYPHAYYIRLSDEGKAGLDSTAKTMGLVPAVAGRVIIEHSVKGKPITLKPDPAALALLKEWSKFYGHSKREHPLNVNVNELVSLIDKTNEFLKVNKGGKS